MICATAVDWQCCKAAPLAEAAMVSLLHSHDVSWRLPEALLVHWRPG